MPSQGTQVYWHNLPEKRPPWRSAAELRDCIQESQQAATSAHPQIQWDDAREGGRKRPRRLPAHKKALRDAKRRRELVVQQRENPCIHRGVVPEPHATPLRVVNLIMAHLGQPAVTYAEADAAVDKVVLHYNTLTQQSQSQAGMMGGTEANARPQHPDAASLRHRRPSYRNDPVAAAAASVLLQSQPTGALGNTQPDNAATTTTSSSSRSAANMRGAGLAVDMQNSLLLDVVGELCSTRAIRFKRLTRADLGAMKYQVTSVEAVPHRRVVLLADRRDPYFAVLFGLSRGVKPEPFVVAALKEDRRSPKSLKRYSRTEIPYTQVFCVAPAPVPWRRVWKSISISAYRNEFAAAVVELDTDKAPAEGIDDERASTDSSGSLSAAREALTVAATRSTTANRHHESNHPSSAFRRTVGLLGADTEEGEWGSEEGCDDVLYGMSFYSAKQDQQVAAMEVKWIKSASMFEEYASAGTGGSDFPNAVGGDGGAGQIDPLQRLPRTDARDRMANGKLRVWYRRLLSRPMEGELMERLRGMSYED